MTEIPIKPFGSTLTDEQLIQLRDRTAAYAELIRAMPVDESKTVAPGGTCAPLEGGFVSAIFAELAQRELDRRAAALEALRIMKENL